MYFVKSQFYQSLLNYFSVLDCATFGTWMDREILRISDALLVSGLAVQDFLTTQHLFLNKGKLKTVDFCICVLSTAHTCINHGTFEAYLSSGKFELGYN